MNRIAKQTHKKKGMNRLQSPQMSAGSYLTRTFFNLALKAPSQSFTVHTSSVIEIICRLITLECIMCKECDSIFLSFTSSFFLTIDNMSTV